MIAHAVRMRMTVEMNPANWAIEILNCPLCIVHAVRMTTTLHVMKAVNPHGFLFQRATAAIRAVRPYAAGMILFPISPTAALANPASASHASSRDMIVRLIGLFLIL